MKIDIIDANTAISRLQEARDNGVTLSSRSLDLLSLEGDGYEDARNDYVSNMKTSPPFVQQTLITCMDVIKKDSDDIDAVSLIVLGTESGHVYVLPQDPSNSNFVCKIALPSSVPVMLSVSGLFDVEWRVVVACRDGKLYTIKGMVCTV